MHYPVTDIQADFEINLPVRYQITGKRNYFPQTTRRTDVPLPIGIFFIKEKILKNVFDDVHHYLNNIQDDSRYSSVYWRSFKLV